MDDKFVSIKFDDHSYKLKHVLMGGVTDGDPEYPMGMFAGNMSIENLGMCVLHAFRAAIKINVDAHGMTVGQSEEFLLFCLAEALRREERRVRLGDDYEDSVLRVTKHNL
jgi:hypothetical protein